MWVWIAVSVSIGVSVDGQDECELSIQVESMQLRAGTRWEGECATESKQHELLKSLMWFSCAPGCKKPSPPDTIDSTRDKLCQS